MQSPLWDGRLFLLDGQVSNQLVNILQFVEMKLLLFEARFCRGQEDREEARQAQQERVLDRRGVLLDD
jgi:hypothetical protein